jgi:hypothetical protein
MALLLAQHKMIGWLSRPVLLQKNKTSIIIEVLHTINSRPHIFDNTKIRSIKRRYWQTTVNPTQNERRNKKVEEA